MAWEEEVYFQMCWRWRNIPKPVIAAAQGKTIAGGLMLLWIADVIIAADDAAVLRPGRRHGRQRRRVLRPPVGARRPQGQGAAVHRRLRRAPRTPDAARHGQPRRAGGRAPRRRDRRWPAASPAARASRSSWPRRASTRRSRRRVSGPRCGSPSRSSTSPTPTTGCASASPSTPGRRPGVARPTRHSTRWTRRPSHDSMRWAACSSRWWARSPSARAAATSSPTAGTLGSAGLRRARPQPWTLSGPPVRMASARVMSSSSLTRSPLSTSLDSTCILLSLLCVSRLSLRSCAQ